MNSFETKFFEKYIPEWQKMKDVIHEHWIKIVSNLFLSLSMAVFIPSIVYFYSERLQSIIPFYAFEIFLIIIFIKIIYDIFDRYNDVWIITDKAIVDLDWALFKTSMKTVNYENIEGLEVDQSGIWDKILRKWNLIVHKIWDDVFLLEDAKIPYKAVDEIERIRNKIVEEEEENLDKFDMVMDTLSWVVKDYLWKNGLPKRYENPWDYAEDLEKEIEKRKWTIDLR